MQFLRKMGKKFTTCSNCFYLPVVHHENRHLNVKCWNGGCCSWRSSAHRSVGWVFVVGDRDDRSIVLLTISLGSLRYINNSMSTDETTRWPDVGHWAFNRDRLRVTDSEPPHQQSAAIIYPWEYVLYVCRDDREVQLFYNSFVYLLAILNSLYYCGFTIQHMCWSNQTAKCDGIKHYELCIQREQSEPQHHLCNANQWMSDQPEAIFGGERWCYCCCCWQVVGKTIPILIISQAVFNNILIRIALITHPIKR